MADDLFTNHFRACTNSALHLEMRDGYMLDDPMYLEWKAGVRYEPADRDSWWHPWYQLMSDCVGRGVDIRRARIVSEPVSDYVRFEYEVSFANITAGEQIRWLPRRRATDIALPGNDFWLFDHQQLLVNHFSGDGDTTGHEVITDADVIKLCVSAFEAVWERAIPHDDYRPS